MILPVVQLRDLSTWSEEVDLGYHLSGFDLRGVCDLDLHSQVSMVTDVAEPSLLVNTVSEPAE